MDSRPAMGPFALAPGAAAEETSCSEDPHGSTTSLCQRELEIERGPNWLFVRIKPCRPTPDRQRVSLAQQVTEALDRHFINRVVLEFEDASLPCDRLIAEIRALEQWVCDHDGVLRLCGLPVEYARRISHAHLTNRYPLYHDREEAVWAGSRPSQPR